MRRELDRTRIAAAGACVLVLAMSCSPATAGAPSALAAEPPGAAPDEWRFGLGLYGWLENFGGNIESPGGAEVAFTIPFSEIFDRLEAVLEVTAEVGYRRWFLVFDGMWATLAGGYQGNGFDLDVEYDQTILDLHGGYRVYRRAWVDAPASGRKRWVRISAVDVILGARHFREEVAFTEYTRITGRTNRTSVDSAHWDPLLGVRGAHSLSGRWVVDLAADVGGFGIGGASDLAYQVDASVAFRVTHALAAFVGYRVLSYEFDEDAGGSSTMTQYGPKVGVTLQF